METFREVRCGDDSPWTVHDILPLGRIHPATASARDRRMIELSRS